MESNKLTPTEAAELAGKLVFLNTTMFGKTGRTAMVCIYGRQHSPTSNTKTIHAMTASLRTLMTVVTSSPPRCVVFRRKMDNNMPVIYADAFFELGDADSLQDAQKKYQRPGIRKQHPQCQTDGEQ